MELPMETKKDFIKRVYDIWDTLTERERGRLEGQMDVYEKLAAERKPA